MLCRPWSVECDAVCGAGCGGHSLQLHRGAPDCAAGAAQGEAQRPAAPGTGRLVRMEAVARQGEMSWEHTLWPFDWVIGIGKTWLEAFAGHLCFTLAARQVVNVDTFQLLGPESRSSTTNYEQPHSITLQRYFPSQPACGHSSRADTCDGDLHNCKADHHAGAASGAGCGF